jgi:L-alanine-DL-glutamate epimerase-like enolase superfamily enzyme
VRIAEVRPLVLGTAWRNLTFVVIRTDDGLEGVGEVRMINETEALLGYLAEAVPVHVLGADPFEIEPLIQRLWRREYARAGQVAMSALAVLARPVRRRDVGARTLRAGAGARACRGGPRRRRAGRRDPRRDARAALPHGPGLGVTLDEDVVAEHPRRPIHFDLFAADWHLRRPVRA